MTGRSRQTLRILILALIAAAVVGIAGVLVRHEVVSDGVALVTPVNGWAAMGVRFTRDGAHDARMRVSADTVTTAPVRMGVFSIGFLQRIEASGVEVVVDLGAADAPHDLGFDLREALGAIAGPSARGKRFSGGRIDNLTVRIEASGRSPLEIRAGRCDVRTAMHRRILLHDHVVVQADDHALTFASLAYDVAAHRFAAEDGTMPSASERRSIESANAALRRVVGRTPASAP